MLNTDSPLPLYRQLADRLTAAIHGGRYAPGEAIPSEHELAERYGIGRPTVRHATEVLVRRGLLERRRGAGTFVLGQRPDALEVFSMAGTLASLREHGAAVRTHLVGGACAMVVDPAADQPFAGRQAHFVARVTETAQGPALLEETYLDPEVFAGFEELELGGGSLSELVREHYKSDPTGGRQELSVARLDAARAPLLELEQDAPVLLARRFLDFPRGADAIYSEIFHRTDRVVLSQTMERF